MPGFLKKRGVIIAAVLIVVGIIYVVNQNNKSAGDGGSPNGAAAVMGGTGCQVTITADVLNVRATPDEHGKIVGKFNRDAKTDAQPVVQNGFRKLADDKWVAAEFARPVSGSNCG